MYQKKKLGCALAALAVSVCMGGCGQAVQESEGISFLGNEAVRIMDAPVTIGEYMLYAVGVSAPYDGAGEGYWSGYSYNAQGVKETNETIVKEEIAESIRIVKVLCAAGEEKYGISLTKEEEGVLKENAAAYYSSLVENGVEEGFLTPELVARFVKEQYLSEKVYKALLEKYTAGGDGGDEEDVPEAFMEEVSGLLAEYDGSYRYQTSINWTMLDRFRFADSASGADGADLDNAVSYLLREGGKEE